MSVDIKEVLKSLGEQVVEQVKSNAQAAAAQLTPGDIAIIERAGLRKAELLLARMLGQDTTSDEAQIDATLGFLASKVAAVARDTIKSTVLEVVTTAGKIALKLVFGAIIP